MGTSTDAILIYGVALTQLDDTMYSGLPFAKLHSEDEEFEDYIGRAMGITRNPSEGYYRRRMDAVEAYPLELIRHCSEEYPMWVLGLRATTRRASRGHPDNFGSLPEPSMEDVAFLTQFMREMELEGDMGWLLFSDWR